MRKKIVSIVCPCLNEAGVIKKFHHELSNTISKINNYIFEIIYIDNHSTDNTREILRSIAKRNSNVKLIFNTRNFGHIRSPYYAMLQSNGDAVVMICTDLQEPPQLILKFIKEWEKGYEIVLGIKNKSKENFLMFHLRNSYYTFLDKISDVRQIKGSTGFGLYTKKFVNLSREIGDPYPYVRGLVSEFGLKLKKINFTQNKRYAGVTKNNFFTLYDMAILGVVSHSSIPIRLTTLIGFIIGVLSVMIGFFYFLMKLFYWDRFEFGFAPLIIGIFLLFGILFFLIGIIGEYILSIHRALIKKPYVVEEERINF